MSYDDDDDDVHLYVSALICNFAYFTQRTWLSTYLATENRFVYVCNIFDDVSEIWQKNRKITALALT